MVATQTQLRRGTAAQCDAMTPAEAEPIVDLTNDRIRIGDGVVMGGIPLPNAFDNQMMAFNFGVAGGSANAITLTLSPAPTYGQPLTVKFRASNTNTGATTIDVNGLGTKSIKKMSGGSLVDLVAGDIVSGGHYEISYDGVQFQLTTLYNSGIISVSQGNLNTSTGTFSALATGSTGSGSSFFISTGVVTLPGGQYGFELQTAVNFATPTAYFGGWWYGTGLNSTSLLSHVRAWTLQTAGTVFGQQRYVMASPPFDLGDGEVGGFIFLLMEGDNIIGHYAADVPPWAYNGPTNIRADYICPITKKKFRSVSKKRTFDEIMSGSKSNPKLEEITHELKNSDMGLIPHPFGKLQPGQRVVLLDPMSDKTQRIIEHHNSDGGNEFMEALNKGHIKIDNDPIKRKCPKSVQACKFSYKRT